MKGYEDCWKRLIRIQMNLLTKVLAKRNISTDTVQEMSDCESGVGTDTEYVEPTQAKILRQCGVRKSRE